MTDAGTSVARTHIHDGRVVECVSPDHAPLAIDAESVNGPAARELAARLCVPVAELLVRWTRAEVAAKLLGRPSLLAFRKNLADDPLLVIRTAVVDDLVVSVGRRTKSPRYG